MEIENELTDSDDEINEDEISIQHESKKIIEVDDYLAPDSIIAGLNESFKVYVTLPVKEKGKKAVLTKMPFLLQVPPGYVTKGLVDQTASNFELQDAIFKRVVQKPRFNQKQIETLPFHLKTAILAVIAERAGATNISKESMETLTGF